MADSIHDIQSAYVAELRSVAAALRDWWDALVAMSTEESVWFMWPTGLAGHPRVIAIFRKYYFKIEDLNRRNRVDFADSTSTSEGMWGKDELGAAAAFERHFDRLVLDMPALAPDVAELVDGLVFVPVGIDASEAPV